jgi:hypothetical protein
MLGSAPVSRSTTDRTVPPYQSSVIDCLVALVQALHRRTANIAAPEDAYAAGAAVGAEAGAHPDAARRRRASVSVLSLCHALFAQSKVLLERESDVADGVKLLSAVLALLSRAVDHTGRGASSSSSRSSSLSGTREVVRQGRRGGGDADPTTISITETTHERTPGETVVRECLGVLAEAVHAHMDRYHGNRTIISLIHLTMRAMAECVPVDDRAAASRCLPARFKEVLPRLAADWVLGTSMSDLRSTLRR